MVSHYVCYRITAKDITVYLGKSSIRETDANREQKFAVDQIINHQDYIHFEGTYNNDIGGCVECGVCLCV